MRHHALALLACTALVSPAAAQSPQPPPSYKPIAPLTPATSGDIAEERRLLHADIAAMEATILAQLKAQQADANARAAEQKAVLDAILAQLKAAPAAIVATGTAPSAAVAAGTAPTTTTAAVDSFPADPGRAPCPSPENTSILRLGATISGAPYARDLNCSIHTLGPASPGKAGYFVNGVELQVWDHASKVTQLTIRQGKAYVQIEGGVWQQSQNGVLYNSGLPDAWADGKPPSAAATTASTASTASRAPATVAPSAVAPGSTGHVLTVGKDCPTLYACVKAAVDGDTIDGAGALVRGAAPYITASVEMRNFRMDCSTGELAQGKGCLVNQKDVIYRNVEVFGAVRNPAIDNGVGCIRAGDVSTVTVIGGSIHDCPQGFAGGGFAWAAVLNGTHLYRNGLGDGLTHNLYVSQGTVSLTLIDVTSDAPMGGHAVKSRAAAFSCLRCTLSADETLIDLPNGTASVATVKDSTLTKTPATGNHRLIGYGEEGPTNGTAGMTVTGGTVSGGQDPFIQGQGGTVTFSGTTVQGTKPKGQGVTVSGL